MTEADIKILPGEVNFSPEERYQVRLVLEAFKGMSLDELLEVSRLAKTGRVARTVIVVIGKIIGYAGGLFAAVLAYKSLWPGKLP